ncbi:hypothetical protein GF339_12480 [candidate division KSB3 bacterium]|jgi:hypothetical protein|uniref:SnoaL-like domain-containing protein n=1 Tax=candidate division KSB3 bacterium TaxID=2044937 RepID=A0A9D5JWG8_9BACT|nr:hypothetical protein [candidate division KSB3 bacterium]MBD3325398.1 hypothetical protein [candidate division KSB3 bacterium]
MVKYIGIGLLGLIVLGVGWYVFFNEERRVKARFESLAEWVSKEPDEQQFAMARKIKNIESVFADPSRFDVPARDVSGTFPPSEIARRAALARSRFSQLTVKFYDLEVVFLAEDTALTTTTATLSGTTTDGEAIEETHELQCMLQKTDDAWLFQEVEVVEVLQK